MPTLASSRMAAAAYGARGAVAAAALGAADRLVQWSALDDRVLAAVVTEFGVNWSLVADVLRAATAMSGHYRRYD
eukprot:33158-Chlamydomonas_euryale.AAC.1